MKAPLIVLEGIDGAGTTTQAARLAARLAYHHRGHVVTRQPSDGPIGRLLREMLTGNHVGPDGQAPDSPTFGLLFAADRLNHIQREVMPALTRGDVVISDRWYHSSLAYQADIQLRPWIRELNRYAMAPDLTVFLRTSVATAEARRLRAGRTEELFESRAAQLRIAAAYEDVMRVLTPDEPIAIIDGELGIDEVTEQIWQLVQPLLSL